jgi:hypothetical protein
MQASPVRGCRRLLKEPHRRRSASESSVLPDHYVGVQSHTRKQHALMTVILCSPLLAKLLLYPRLIEEGKGVSVCLSRQTLLVECRGWQVCGYSHCRLGRSFSL